MTEQHTFSEWLNDRRLSDVVFVHRSAPDRIAAYAHRAILAGRSSYWFKYFANPPAAATTTTPTTTSLPPAATTTTTNTGLSIKSPTVVTSLEDDGDVQAMDSSDDDKSSDTITILINEHIDAFRAVLNHIYTGRLPNISDGPAWLPDFVNLSRLYELPALMYLTRRYAKLAAPSSTSATAAAPSSAAVRRHDGFLSPDLADGAHNIATGVHVTVGGAKTLSVSIGNSGVMSPNDDSTPSTPTHHHHHHHHLADGSSPASSSHPSTPRASALDLTSTRNSGISHRSNIGGGETKYEGSTTASSAAAAAAGAGSDDMNPVVIMKVDPIILAARSNYFRIMFSGRWRETHKGSVHLPNLSEAQFRAVLSYCYRGCFNLHDCTAKDAVASSPLVADVETPLRFGYRLIDIARFFGMPDLVHYCQSLMQALLTPINCATVWLASTNAMHLAPTLARACVEYFRANFLQCCLLTSSPEDASALAALAAASVAEAKTASSTAAATPSASASMPPFQTESQRRRAWTEWLASERNRQSSIKSAAAIISRLPLRSSFLALQPQHLLDALGPGTISVDTHVMLSIVEQWADAYARSGRPLLDRHSLPPGAAAALRQQIGSSAPSPTPSEEMNFLRQQRRFSASPRNDEEDEDLVLLAAYAANAETPTSSAPATPITSTSSSSSSFTTSTAAATAVPFGPALPPSVEDRRITARRVALKAALLPPGTLFNASHRSWLLGRRPTHLPPGIF